MNINTIINHTRSDTIEIQLAFQYLTSSSHKQDDIEALVEKLKTIQTYKSGQLLDLISKNQHKITILDRPHKTAAHIEALHRPRKQDDIEENYR
jgi:hypothetical protein